MSIRTKYVLLYIASVIAPIVIFILGAIFVFSGQVANSILSITALYFICILIFFVGGFLVNFWYSKTLGMQMIWRVLASIFNTVGFFYLLGYDQKLISATQIIQESIDLYKIHWKLLIKYSLVFLVPMFILGLIGSIIFLLSSYLHAPAIINGLIVLLLVTTIMIAMLWISISLAKVIKNLIDKQPIPSFVQTLKGNENLLWPIIYTSVIVTLIVIGGSLLFLVPGIIFSVWYVFVFYTIIFEKEKGLSALRFSKSMVIGRWFSILWRTMIPATVFGASTMLITLILQLPVMFFPTNDTTIFINGVISNLTSIIIMPLSTTSIIILYLNAKKTQPPTSNQDTPVIM